MVSSFKYYHAEDDDDDDEDENNSAFQLQEHLVILVAAEIKKKKKVFQHQNVLNVFIMIMDRSKYGVLLTMAVLIFASIVR